MPALLPPKLLLFFLVFFLFCPPFSTSAIGGSASYLAGGVGVARINYKEKIPEFELTSSDSDVLNLALYLEARKAMENFFIGAKGWLPLTTGETREYWARSGELQQSNSLTCRRAQADAHAGYFLHRWLNPYIGVHWSYAEQERSRFEDLRIPQIITGNSTEEVNSFAALIGIQGSLPVTGKWSLSYFAEYMLPFYSRVTNSSIPDWEATDINGYSYALAGRLSYAYSENVAAALQITGGRQHWDGSDWIRIDDVRVKWPENDTDYINFIISVYRYF